MPDLSSEVYEACRGDDRAMAYLAGLTEARWKRERYVLGQFLQEGELDDPEWMARFCQIFVMIMDHHGRDVLTDYLQSRSDSSRISAMKVIDFIGDESVTWAIPLLKTSYADATMQLYTRNKAAAIIAKITGDDRLPALTPASLPVTPQALRDALETLDLMNGDETDAVVECANALGDDAKPILAQRFETWLEDELSMFSLGFFARRCPPLSAIILDALEQQDVRFNQLCILAKEVFWGEIAHEDRFERYLAAPPASADIAVIADTLASITREKDIESLDHKDERQREYSRGVLAELAPRHIVRQGPMILDALVSVGDAQRWGVETDEIRAALRRADPDALARSIGDYLKDGHPDDRYWRSPRTYYQKRYLVDAIHRLAATEPWAQRLANNPSQR